MNMNTPMIRDDFIKEANTSLKHKHFSDILKWTVENFTEDCGIITAFGYSGLVLLHQLKRIYPDIPVYFINTGFHFQETIELAEKLRQEWQINLSVLNPKISRKELELSLGPEPFKNPDQCCRINKTEPFEEIAQTKKVWISALRRDQSITRKDIDIVTKDPRGFLKIHPLCYFTSAEIWDYIRINEIPYSKLHDKNYLSIGCYPCTAPVKNNMHEREGRWPALTKLECGLHLLH